MKRVVIPMRKKVLFTTTILLGLFVAACGSDVSDRNAAGELSETEAAVEAKMVCQL